MLVYIHVRNYLYKVCSTLLGEKYYNNYIYYPGEGRMFTTLALFVLKLETMLLLETVLTLPLLLLWLLLPWFAVFIIRVGAENRNVAVKLLIFLTWPHQIESWPAPGDGRLIIFAPEIITRWLGRAWARNNLTIILLATSLPSLFTPDEILGLGRPSML